MKKSVGILKSANRRDKELRTGPRSVKRVGKKRGASFRGA